MILKATSWLLLLAAEATAQASYPIDLTNFQGALLAKAVPDDCWAGLGQNKRGDFPPCPAGEIPKVNQAYIWSMVETGGNVWIGTAANPLCGFTGEAVTIPFLELTPYANSSWACEFGKSPYSPSPYTAGFGDLRPPRIFVYNIASQALTEVTPKGHVTYDNPWGVDTMVLETAGFRAAAVVGNAVMFAGPSINGGINLLAFDATDFTWLAKGTLSSAYMDIRKFLWVNGVLYTGVATSQGGSLLRYTGQIPSAEAAPLLRQGPPACRSCFTFSDVADFDGQPANLAYDGASRVYVGTWPVKNIAGIYMSPPVPAGGFVAHGPAWTKVFDISQYEPDPVQATAYGIGAMASFGGYLYFGTQNPPFSGMLAYINAYGDPTSTPESNAAEQNSFRTTAVFRMSGQENGPPHVDLLYGEATLPVYTAPPLEPHSGSWALTPNNLTNGQPAIYGHSGFNNPYNAYTWSMVEWNTRLYVGTFDWSYLAPLFPNGDGNLPPPDPNAGADLFSFTDTGSAAAVENNTGIGNYTNYGVRNIITDANGMYLGMANNMNLMTTAANGLPLGGWELIQIVPKP